MGEQPRDLGFQGAGVDDLAERGVGGQGQQIAGYVKGAGLEGAGEVLGLDGLGARDAALEGGEDGGGGALVGVNKAVGFAATITKLYELVSL